MLARGLVGLVLLGSLAFAVGLGSRAGTAHSASEAEKLIISLKRPVGTSNLWRLTARVKLHRRSPIPRIVNSHPPNYPIGHSDRLWVLDGNTDIYRHVRATILCETPHLYFYVQTSVHVDRRSACKSARFFEHHIYPTDRRVFGSEWRPGIDGDVHVTLFYGHVPGVAGYYAGEDEYPKLVNKYSNQREILFISSDYTTLGSEFDSTLAHEFQHMIHWHVHAQDEAWDNEGASMLAQIINGFSADGVDQAYAFQPVQLDAWTDGANSDPYYGAGFLWMDYLYERFGPSFVQAMLENRHYSGIALAAQVLHKRTSLSLTKVFGDWVVANYLDRPRLAPRFGYHNTQIHISPNASLGKRSIRYATHLHPYMPFYLAVKPLSEPRVLHFSAAPSIPLISAGRTAPFWWSNRCDFCETSMTRTINLRKAHRPVLTFKAWYRIETGYDYAYLEVSRNRGATWHTLPSRISTKQNPNGGNLGNGITGQSNKVHGNHRGWVSVRVKLRRYAGKKVRLRFQYVTDDEYNGQSLAIRDMAIKAIHYRDHVGDSAWHLSGFVPVMQNRLPLRWSIRLITYPRGVPKVNSVSVGPRGHASIKIPRSRKSKQAALAIFGQAPKTTLEARLRITS